MRNLVLSLAASLVAMGSCVISKAPSSDSLLHFALWYLIISQEYDRKKGTK